MSRAFLSLLALIVPPVVLTATRRTVALSATVAWVVAIAIFFFVAWGPGLLLASVSGIVAAGALLNAGKGTA